MCILFVGGYILTGFEDYFNGRIDSLTAPLDKDSTDDRKYVCKNCGRRYKSSGALWNHSKYECGKKPEFECHICFKKFTRPSSVRGHIIHVHNTLS